MQQKSFTLIGVAFNGASVYCGRTKQSRFINQCKEVRPATASLLSHFLARSTCSHLTPSVRWPAPLRFFDLELQGIHEKIKKLRIKILREKPAIPFLDKKNARLRGLITANNG
jgi:hypothetical protein